MIGGIANAARPISSSGAPKPMMPSRESAPPLALRQINAQRPIDRFVGAHQVVVDLRLPRRVAQLAAEALEVLPILLAQPLRIDEQAVAGVLQVTELRPLLERELQLLRRQDRKSTRLNSSHLG